MRRRRGKRGTERKEGGDRSNEKRERVIERDSVYVCVSKVIRRE